MEENTICIQEKCHIEHTFNHLENSYFLLKIFNNYSYMHDYNIYKLHDRFICRQNRLHEHASGRLLGRVQNLN